MRVKRDSVSEKRERETERQKERERERERARESERGLTATDTISFATDERGKNANAPIQHPEGTLKMSDCLRLHTLASVVLKKP